MVKLELEIGKRDITELTSPLQITKTMTERGALTGISKSLTG